MGFRPNSWPIEKRVEVGFGIALALLLLTGFAAAWSVQRNVETFRWVDHTHTVLTKIEQLRGQLLNAETGARGFSISGEEDFLESRTAPGSNPLQTLEEFYRLTQDNSTQRNRAAALEPLIQKKLDHLSDVVQLRRGGRSNESLQRIAGGEGRETMNSILGVLTQMKAQEELLLQERSDAARLWGERARLVALVGGIVAIVLVSVACLAVRRDFRKRKEAEMERDRFFTLSIDMLCVASSTGYFLRVNPAFGQTLGWTVEELQTRPFLSFVHPDDAARTLREVERQVVEGRPVLQFENRYQSKDGSWRVLCWNSVPQEGGLMFATARDVTSVRAAAEALRRSEESLAITLHSIGDAVLTTDREGKVARLNPVAEKLTGWSETEACGRPIDEVFRIFNETTKEPAVVPVASVLETGQIQNLANHLVIVAKDGTERAVADSAAPIRGRDGQILGVVLVFRDVTTERLAEKAILQLNTDLKRQAAVITATNQELEAFSYSVSHDLRAPLRHIQGFVSLLSTETQAAGISDKARHYLKTISKSSEEMGELIDNLLEFSRMGRSEMRQTKVNLGQLANSVVTSLELDLRDRKIEWKIAELPQVEGDRAMLKQVLANLLGNAVKYTRPRDPAVIEMGTAGTEGDHIIFFVRDNGVGFDMRYAEKLFGVFQRLHRVDEFEGTGIGLANVSRIVNRHGGRVWAESKLKEGATFFFTLRPSSA